MEPIRCFLIEETDKLERLLRRYHSGECPAPWRRLNGMTPLDVTTWPKGTIISMDVKPESLVSRSDERWPKQCDCGRVFVETDHWQIFVERVYARVDTGEEMNLRNAPPGAIYNAWWYGQWRQGPDGKSMVVKCPPDGWDWLIDGPASNCTIPNDTVHRCWVRHGEPPNLTVDKNGVTCAAGAGSIQTPKWHGFLRDGYLV